MLLKNALDLGDAITGVSQASYPRVSFLASVAASNMDRQLEAIQADLRSNLTTQFAPVVVGVHFFAFCPAVADADCWSGEGSSSLIYSLESGKLAKDTVGALPLGKYGAKDVCQRVADRPNLRHRREENMKSRPSRIVTHAKQAGPQRRERCDKGSVFCSSEL